MRIYTIFLRILLTLSPYSQAYGPIPVERTKMSKVYKIFTQGKKAIINKTSPYAKYAKKGLRKSKEFTKLGYGYSLHGVKYSYEKGKDGWYYVTIAKEHVVPVLFTAKNYAGSVANLPTILPICGCKNGLIK